MSNRPKAVLIGVSCLTAFVLGEIAAARSLFLLRPYSHFVSRYLWTQQHGFFAGFEILLWPLAGFLLFIIWAVWAANDWLGSAWWRSVVPASATFALMMVLFKTPDILVDAYFFAGGTAAALAIFLVLKQSTALPMAKVR